MGRFATHEDEVDDLFRGGVFVDLYRVVRQGLRAGVESYSIKRLEPLIGFERQVDLDEATEHLIAFESALEDGEARRRRDDPGGSRGLQRGRLPGDARPTGLARAAAGRAGGRSSDEPPPRPSVEADDEAQVDPEVVRLKGALLEGVPDDPAERSEEDEAKALLADLLEWHRQEAKPAWWRFFRLREMSSAELVDEPDAIGELVGRRHRGQGQAFHRPPIRVPSPGARLRTGRQGTGSRVQQDVDRRRRRRRARDDRPQDRQGRQIASRMRRCPRRSSRVGQSTPRTSQARVRDLADRVAGSGFGAADAAIALLLRRRPGAGSAGRLTLRHDGEPAGDAARRIILGLGGSYLPIQGPPGAGQDLHRRRRHPWTWSPPARRSVSPPPRTR